MSDWPDGVELAPVVVQDPQSGRVLMLAWMNAEAHAATLATGFVTFWSRSRRQMWEKGATSGNRLRLVSTAWDCDRDALLVRAIPDGPTCHTGQATCFDDAPLGPGLGRLDELWRVVVSRAAERPPGSYTTGLLESGAEGIGRKVTEEAIEVLLAAKDHATGIGDVRRVAEEVADLLFHTLVLLAERGVDPGTVLDALASRRHRAADPG